MNLVCGILRTREALLAARDEMAVLAEGKAHASSIVQHPDWVLYEVESRDDGTVPHVVVVRDDAGAIVGYAPLLQARHVARLDLAGRRLDLYKGMALRLLGSGVVTSPALRTSVSDAIAGQLASERALRVLRIQEAMLPDPLARALASHKGFRLVAAHLREQVHWIIDPQPSSEAWLATLEKKKRTDLLQRVGRAYRKLGGDAALHRYTTPEQMPEYCRLLEEAYKRTWHHSDLPIDWQAPARVTLFQRLASAGQLVGHIVLRAGKPLAYVHGYRLGGTYLVEDLGYDEDVAKVGIGSVAVFQAVRGILDQHPGERISFGYGDNQYKRVLATRSEPCGSLYAVRAGASTVGFHMYGPARWFYGNLRRLRERNAPSAM